MEKELMERGRHGDLAIDRVQELPKGLKKITNGNILAEGEATGHHHKLVAEPNCEVNVFVDENGNKYFEVIGKAKLTHQEHKTITIHEGYYRVQIEKEFDPWAEELRRVAD